VRTLIVLVKGSAVGTGSRKVEFSSSRMSLLRFNIFPLTMLNPIVLDETA